VFATYIPYLQNLSRKTLLKNFIIKFLISHSILRIIVKCFNRGLFINRDNFHIVYNKIMKHGLQNTAYIQNIMIKYNEPRNK